jgi:hypothetical protein
MPHTLPSQALEHIPDHVLEKHPEFANVLAVAFTDQNGNHTYEPVKDTLIASLLDTNRDGVVSVGDTIHWGTYPTTFDGSGPRGNFTGPDELVQAVDFVGSGGVDVQTALGDVAWTHTGFEALLMTAPGFPPPTDAFIRDDLTLPDLSFRDLIFADPSVQGPGHPDTPVAIDLEQLGNQGFIDVLILI